MNVLAELAITITGSDGKGGSALLNLLTNNRSFLCIYALSWLVAITGCVKPPPPDYWPTQDWQTSTPEAQGMDSGLLAQTVDLIREQGLALDSLLIMRHGYVVIAALTSEMIWETA